MYIFPSGKQGWVRISIFMITQGTLSTLREEGKQIGVLYFQYQYTML